MKVLLFVQDEKDGPWRCIGWTRKAVHTIDQPLFAFSYAQEDAAKSAHAWKIIECDNARQGRKCIEGSCEPYRCRRSDGPLSCRVILAGGRP